MMVEVPGEIPVTRPEEESMVATKGSLLLQTPLKSVRVVVRPAHTESGPRMV